MTVARFDPPAAGRQLALVNPTTDSWTAVLGDVVQLAENIANTEFVPLGLRGSTPKVVAAILHGRELGLPPMTALAHTSVINGRPGTSAEVMRALILQAGHDLHIERSDARQCTIRGRRSGWAEDRWTTVSFSIEDAAKAGLMEDKRSREGKITPSMYKKWPAAMLLARATTIIARMIYADVIHGMRSVEELQDMTEPGEWVESTPPPATVAVSRQAAAPAGKPVADVAPPVATVEDAPAEAAPAAPVRRRPPLGRTRTTSAPAAPEPETAAAPEAEVVDAEVVDDAPAAKEPTSIADVKAELRRKAITSIQMHFERLLGSPVDREERLWWTGLIIARPVDSTNDLSSDEVRAVLARLERFRSREQLEATLAPQEGGQ